MGRASVSSLFLCTLMNLAVTLYRGPDTRSVHKEKAI